MKIAVPMVSFCDIPLSQIKDHIRKYGSYGIGLTKEWAKSNRLSPVQYVAADAHYTTSLREIINGTHPTHGDWNKLSDLEKASFNLRRFLKNYEGTLVRKGKSKSNYRFYDEREWRYVPDYCSDFPMVVDSKSYKTDAEKAHLNQKLSKIRLKFTPEDIKYIIIASDKDIPNLIKFIRDKVGNRCSRLQEDRLITRMITRDQIEHDF